MMASFIADSFHLSTKVLTSWRSSGGVVRLEYVFTELRAMFSERGIGVALIESM